MCSERKGVGGRGFWQRCNCRRNRRKRGRKGEKEGEEDWCKVEFDECPVSRHSIMRRERGEGRV